MATKSSAKVKGRRPLTKERILRAAIHLVDEGGIEQLSMRNLGELLGVGTMSLYNHVANKEEVLDGIIEQVAREIHVPTPGIDWRMSMRQRAISMRELILRHPWASRLIESQNNLGPTRLQSVEAVLGSLRRAGFSIQGAARALLLMDSYIYGFTLQETCWSHGDAASQTTEADGTEPAYPHLSEAAAHFAGGGAGGSSAVLAREFELGFELILDAMTELIDVEGARPPESC